MSWTVLFAPSARRDLTRLDPPVAARMLDALSRFAETGHGNVRRPGRDTWRLRVGDWRIFFRKIAAVDNPTILVLRIRHRGEAYR